MSLFIVRLAHHVMNCSEQTGSGVTGVERTKGHGGYCTKGRFQARWSSLVLAQRSCIGCQEDGVNWVGKCRRKVMLVEHFTVNALAFNWIRYLVECVCLYVILTTTLRNEN